MVVFTLLKPNKVQFILGLKRGYAYRYDALTGDYIRLYFEKGTDTDNDIPTSFALDNFTVTQNRLEILEENNYYPFGLKHKGYNTNVSANVNGMATKYGFQEQEHHEELGINGVSIFRISMDKDESIIRLKSKKIRVRY